MCGIAAMLGRPSASVTRRMTDMLQHRGPDGSGIWKDDDCALGHSRLAIVDVAGSNQPLHSDHGCVAVVNGEIYNHEEIRKNLLSYPWKTRGDSESVLALHHSFKDWVSRLDGIFAICLWDPENKELTLARDPLGVKPLIRTLVDGSLLVASEAKVFRSHEEYFPKINMEAMKTRIAFEYRLGDATLFEDVEQVSPGTYEVWGLEGEKAVLRKRVKYAEYSIEQNETWDAGTLLASLTESLADRLMSDVPVGVVLSGGLDSALVAGLAERAAHIAGQPIPECWTVAEDEENPDWKAAELVAESLGLVHHQRILDDNSLDKAVPRMSWHGEDLDVTEMFFQPLFETMSKDVTVGLCGQGADELHAGYPRYRELDAHRELIRSRLAAMDMQRDLSMFDDLQKTLQFELDDGQLSNFQLRLVDRHSMAHGLEIRVPFLGSAHLKTALALPMNERLPISARWGDEKKALRSAAALTALPKEVVKRPKMPAGRATAPKMLDRFLAEMKPRILELSARYENLERGLKGQAHTTLGLGLFESMHIIDRGIGRQNMSVEGLLDDLL
jgi:asparagine synthase (glutamine-hydrolysing)